MKMINGWRASAVMVVIFVSFGAGALTLDDFKVQKSMRTDGEEDTLKVNLPDKDGLRFPLHVKAMSRLDLKVSTDKNASFTLCLVAKDKVDKALAWFNAPEPKTEPGFWSFVGTPDENGVFVLKAERIDTGDYELLMYNRNFIKDIMVKITYKASEMKLTEKAAEKAGDVADAGKKAAGQAVDAGKEQIDKGKEALDKQMEKNPHLKSYIGIGIAVVGLILLLIIISKMKSKGDEAES